MHFPRHLEIGIYYNVYSFNNSKCVTTTSSDMLSDLNLKKMVNNRAGDQYWLLEENRTYFFLE